MVLRRWRRFERICSTVSGNDEPNCTSLGEYSEDHEHARPRRARAVNTPDSRSLKSASLLRSARSNVFVLVDFDVGVNVNVDLDGDGDVDRDGTSLTVTSSSSAWRPRLPAGGCHLRIAVPPRACGA